MSAEDLEKYETEMELKLYREYRDVVGLFKYVIETERRFYLTNDYEMQVHSVQGEVFFEVSMADAWERLLTIPWIRLRANRRYVTLHDVVAEELGQRAIARHPVDDPRADHDAGPDGPDHRERERERHHLGPAAPAERLRDVHNRVGGVGRQVLSACHCRLVAADPFVGTAPQKSRGPTAIALVVAIR